MSETEMPSGAPGAIDYRVDDMYVIPNKHGRPVRLLRRHDGAWFAEWWTAHDVFMGLRQLAPEVADDFLTTGRSIF